MKKLIALFLFLSLGANVTWAGPGHDHDHGETISGGSSQYPVVTVVQGKAPKDDLQSIEVSGIVLPERFTDVYPLKEGNIQSFSVNVGDYVKKGQVVATMSQDSEQRALAAELAFLEKEVEILSEKSNLLVGHQSTPILPTNLGLENAIQDLLLSVANALYDNPSFLDWQKGAYNSFNFRRSDIFEGSIQRTKALELEKEFLPLYKSFKESGKSQTNSFAESAFNVGRKARQVINGVNLGPLNIESREEILEAKKELNEAVDRLSGIMGESVSTRNDLADINFSLVEKKAEIEKIRYQLGFGQSIIAPFSGYITKRYINLGDPVGPGQPLFALVDNDHRFVRFQVPQETLPFIEKNKEVLFASAYAPLKKEKAIVKRISPSLDPETQMVLVEAEIPGNGSDMPHILSHMKVRVFVPLVSEELAESSLVIPLSALEISKSSSFVWIVNKSVEIEKQEIEVSFIYEDKAYVSKDLGKAWIVIKTPVKPKEHLEVDTRLP